MNNYKKTCKDDFVFVYKKNNDYKVFGMTDTETHDKQLKSDGYRHVATISASLWIESLLNGDVFDREEMIEDIDN